MRTVFVGTSGYAYRHWKGVFYPEELPSHKWLKFYTEHFNSVEINSTFYRIPKQSTTRGWLKKVPDDFRYTLKANRGITHYGRLRGERATKSLEDFFEAITPAKERTGCILYQLPPSLRRDDSLLEDFCSLLAEEYGDWKHAIEFRHNSWLDEATFQTLRRHNICYVLVSGPKQKFEEEVTAPFSYIRLHGATRWYSYNYSKEELKVWANVAKRLLKRCDELFVYFNNDDNAYAVYNAKQLKGLLGVK